MQEDKKKKQQQQQRQQYLLLLVCFMNNDISGGQDIVKHAKLVVKYEPPASTLVHEHARLVVCTRAQH